MQLSKYFIPNKSVAYPLLTLIVCLLITYQAFNTAKTEVNQKIQNYFDFRVREAINLINNRMQAYEHVLLGTAGLYKSANKIERYEFKQYVDTLNLGKLYPGIQGVGFSLIVPSAKKIEHVSSMRNKGFPDYTIWPEGQRDIYTTIIYLEPFTDRNQRAFGYDMFSEPVRHAAMQKAIDTGQAQLSGKIKLVQETGKQDQAGFLMYLPIYDKGKNSNTLSARREHIIGWVYSPFRMDDLMQGLFGEYAKDLDIQIFDGENMSAEALMYDSNGAELATTQLSKTVQVRIANHPWTVHIRPLPIMSSRVETNHLLSILAIGTIISALLSLLIWFLVTGRERAMNAAKHMNSELIKERQRLSSIIEGTHVGTWEWNIQTGETHFNNYWANMIGYALSELEPISIETWTKFIHPDDAKLSRELLEKHFSGKLAFYECEVRIQHKDGHWVWVLDRGKVATWTPDGKPLMMSGTHQDITARKNAEALFHGIFEQSTFLVGMLNQHGHLIYVNKTALSFTSASHEDVIGKYFPDTPWWSNANDRTQLMEAMNSAYAGKYKSFEATHATPDGGYVNVLFSATPVTLEDGIYVSVTGIDITQRKATESRLRMLTTAIEQGPASVVITDSNANLEYVNSRFTEITGYSPTEVVGENPRILQSGLTPKSVHTEMWKKLTSGKRWVGEVINKRKNGEIYYEEAYISPVKEDDGTVKHYVAVKIDITKRKEIEEQVRQLAFYDALTKLPNRRLLNDRLAQMIATNKRTSNYGAIMFLDLDNFKPLNDSHGHDAGDMLLIEVANRLRNCIREMDTVARFGGDEFVVMLSELHTDKEKSTTQAAIVAEKIRAALSEPYRLTINHAEQADISLEHRCTASIGITLFNGSDGNQTYLMKCADVAMYEAKDAGRNQIKFYSE